MAKQPSVGIIVLNYNGGMLTLGCVRSLLRNTDYTNFKTVIVDNGSIDGSVKTFQSRLKGVTVISLKENYGFPKGMNMGAWYLLKKYSPDYLVFASNDTVFPAGQKTWLSTLIADLEENTDAATVNPRYKKPNGTLVYAGANSRHSIRRGACFRVPLPSLETRKKQKVTQSYSAILLIKTAVIKKIGLWDERFSPFWYEDFDIDKRIIKARHTILYNPAVTLIHGESKTLKKIENRIGHRSMSFIGKKNYLRHIFKHFPLPYFIAALCYQLAGECIHADGYRVRIKNPFNALKLLMNLDFRREKVWIKDHEANRRIRDIIKL